MNKSTVTVLLSTYNGEKYLSELLNSILTQTYNNINIFIRDDGSVDLTRDILRNYSCRYNNITFVEGLNVGSSRSFLELLKIAPDSDYYAFADQDDIWLPDKIKKGIELLSMSNANLYHSNYQLVDKNLCNIQTNPKPNVKSMGQAGVLYPCTGCTMIISKYLRDIVNTYTPDFLLMHDTWIFKIALAVCNPIIFDSNAYILYRQHENNVLGGIESNHFKRFGSRVRRLVRPQRTRSKEMRELIKGYGRLMDKQTYNVINTLARYNNYSIIRRIQIAFNSQFRTEVKSKNRLFRLSIILGIY